MIVYLKIGEESKPRAPVPNAVWVIGQEKFNNYYRIPLQLSLFLRWKSFDSKAPFFVLFQSISVSDFDITQPGHFGIEIPIGFFPKKNWSGKITPMRLDCVEKEFLSAFWTFIFFVNGSMTEGSDHCNVDCLRWPIAL